MTRKLPLAGMTRLESITAEFSEALARQYVRLAHEFVSQRQLALASGATPGTAPSRSELPAEINDRLNAFLTSKPEYSPTTQRVCRAFLLELHAMDLGVLDEGCSSYEPLIAMLEIGGDFYTYNGELCIRDVASIPHVERYFR